MNTLNTLTDWANTEPERYKRALRELLNHKLTIHEVRKGPQSLTATVKGSSPYEVRINNWETACDCPDWTYRGTGTMYPTQNTIKACKHMMAVAAWELDKQLRD